MLMIGWALGDYKGPAGPGITFLTRLTLLREVRRLLAFSSYSSPLAAWPRVQPGLACSLASSRVQPGLACNLASRAT